MSPECNQAIEITSIQCPDSSSLARQLHMKMGTSSEVPIFISVVALAGIAYFPLGIVQIGFAVCVTPIWLGAIE